MFTTILIIVSAWILVGLVFGVVAGKIIHRMGE
jgi:hypothetical protein